MTSVSRETMERLSAYHALVQKWNPKINLVAASTLPDFRSRHLDDSLQLFTLADPKAGLWLDLGSGGGLPGLVVAIMGADRQLSVVLVESDQRKSAFLRTAIRELLLPNASVISERIMSIAPQSADHVSARALAPLPQLLEMVHLHMKPTGTAYLMKGRTWRDESARARHDWRFDLDAVPSSTDPEAAILKVTGVSHA
ncbi:16S rRNA (guanine(527)-N(7))-methyltransferase RsmG [Paracoccus liaowanqingii]|uniref:Ribosomal RNA small subunit methyltransferase G n=1 Tax=Paracoccus liaowanqingii TaxID=2560053 RepID=A0A4Z1CTB6_9RHOB|nr:16S rRNA (guanine(527)-N(7))-methyltransferase RsmG [Paracoccus liaowanqingii]TGN68686.1 16S rRNA (guanine(527)-N(7))-methyltransferase RsmG [Paracoccus liaowanqingii]